MRIISLVQCLYVRKKLCFYVYLIGTNYVGGKRIST